MKNVKWFLPALIFFAVEEIIKFLVFIHPAAGFNNSFFAFGVLKNQNLFFQIFAFLLILICYFSTIKTPQGKQKLTYLNIAFAGVLSNFIDRFAFGGVIDYFKLDLFDFQIIFNLSDLMILTGVFLYAYSFFSHFQYGSNSAR